MSEVEKLKILKDEITKNYERVDSINSEVSKLLLNDNVKKYIKLQQELSKLINRIEVSNKKLIKIEQEICNHRLLFFQSLYSNRQPNFLCIECGKQLNGFIKEDQICVNEDHLIENDQGIFGICIEYGNLKDKYLELKKQGLSIEEIGVKLKEELKNDGGSKNKKLIKLLVGEK